MSYTMARAKLRQALARVAAGGTIDGLIEWAFRRK
jgi:hypothetical protein